MMNVSVECIRKKGNIFELEILKLQEFKKFKIPILHFSNIKEKLNQKKRVEQCRNK